jgi:Reverse transcriptase (RNA-dependent DNA polymerase)
LGYGIFNTMELHKKTKDWFKVKGYVHLSPKLQKNDKSWIEPKVSDSEFVSKYAFYPLIHRKLTQRRYKVPKGGEIRENSKNTEKPREIFYASHLDTQIYSYYAKEILGKIYENKLANEPDLSNCICAYRSIKASAYRNKSNVDFAKEAFVSIISQGDCVALAYDVEKFFDTLDHVHLKKSWCALLEAEKLPKDHYNIFKSLTNFSFVEENDLIREFDFEHFKDLKRNEITCYCCNPKEFRERIRGGKNKKGKTLIKKQAHKGGIAKGIPQGTAISAFLANLYLLEFDKVIYQKVVVEFKGLYRRYSDDIIIACRHEHEKEINDLVLSEIAKYKLVINADKTERSEFVRIDDIGLCCKPLRYLGFEFDGNRILIKASGLAKYYRKAKILIKVKAGKARKLQKKKITNNTQIYRRKIYKQYTHLGKRNFISYVNRASDILEDPSVLRQVKRHWKIMNSYIERYEDKYNLPRR